MMVLNTHILTLQGIIVLILETENCSPFFHLQHLDNSDGKRCYMKI